MSKVFESYEGISHLETQNSIIFTQKCIFVLISPQNWRMETCICFGWKQWNHSSKVFTLWITESMFRSSLFWFLTSIWELCGKIISWSTLEGGYSKKLYHTYSKKSFKTRKSPLLTRLAQHNFDLVSSWLDRARGFSGASHSTVSSVSNYSQKMKNTAIKLVDCWEFPEVNGKSSKIEKKLWFYRKWKTQMG